MIEGFPVLAPWLLEEFDGYATGVHEDLAAIESGNFWFEHRNALLASALRQHFPMVQRILEIGCGNGFVLSRLANAAPAACLVGAEAMLSGLHETRRRLPNAELLQMDARCLPFEAEFDVLGAFDVLEHIEEDEMVLRQMHRALKAGGGLLLTVPQHPRLWSATDEYAHHKRRYTCQELVGKVRGAGFHPLRTTSFMSLLLPLMFASRMRMRFQKRSPGDAAGTELRLSPIINRVLAVVCAVERAILNTGITLPLGGSLLCIATKDAR